MLKSPKKN